MAENSVDKKRVVRKVIRPNAQQKEEMILLEKPKNTPNELIVRQNREVALPRTRDERTEEIQALTKNLQSTFKGDVSKVVAMLEDDSLGAGSELLKSLIRTVAVTIPFAENAIIESDGKKGIHAFTQLLNSARSLSQDLITIGDRANIGDRIFESHVRPLLYDVAAQVTLAFSNLEASAKAKMSREDFSVFQKDVSLSRNGLASYMQKRYESAGEAIRAAMS